jgi:hypothetical protein
MTGWYQVVCHHATFGYKELKVGPFKATKWIEATVLFKKALLQFSGEWDRIIHATACPGAVSCGPRQL